MGADYSLITGGTSQGACSVQPYNKRKQLTSDSDDDTEVEHSNLHVISLPVRYDG